MVARQFISSQLVIRTPLYVVFWCGWIVGSVCKTPDTIRLSHVTAFPAPLAVVLGDQEISSSLSIFPCGEPVIQKSLQGDRRRVWGLCIAKAAILQWAKILKEVSFFLDWGMRAKHFLSSCSALGWSEQMLPQCFSLSSTPTYHLLHQSPHSPISSACFTSDPQSRPSICCTELRQYRRHLTLGIYN